MAVVVAISAVENKLIESLIVNDVFGQETELIETHISWVLLAGQNAYKIKKPLNLGFLDFSDLDKRRFYCQEELRLNNRFTSNLYLGIREIRGTLEKPTLDASGPVLEYAVCMVRFPQDAILSHRVAAGKVSLNQMSSLAQVIFDFHKQQDHPKHSPSVDLARRYGSPQRLITPVRENFSFFKNMKHDEKALIDELERWTISSFEQKLNRFELRLQKGMIRECHGDLHLGNIILLDGKFSLFDCIEFSEQFRWIDTMSEIGFLVMDLIDKGAPGHSNRLLNHYLELSGDYGGLEVLPFYIVYRAMVRAKIHLLEITSKRNDPQQAQQAMEGFRHYLHLAREQTREVPGFLAIMHGASGTGKTTFARLLADHTGAIQLRSDVERKRLFNLSPLEQSSSVAETIYTEQTSERTFTRLEKLAEQVLAAGYNVIVDAVFLRQPLRDRFARLADRLNVRFSIVSCIADSSTVADRLRHRQQRKDDASEAGYQQYLDQISCQEPLTARERECAISIDTTRSIHYQGIRDFLYR